jgi:hypothetical protein
LFSDDQFIQGLCRVTVSLGNTAAPYVLPRVSRPMPDAAGIFAQAVHDQIARTFRER